MIKDNCVLKSLIFFANGRMDVDSCYEAYLMESRSCSFFCMISVKPHLQPYITPYIPLSGLPIFGRVMVILVDSILFAGLTCTTTIYFQMVTPAGSQEVYSQ